MPEPRELAQQKGECLPLLVELMRRLLAPGGCPWDREQTLASLRPFVMEEACEVIDAIGRGDLRELCEELGDLLLQIVFLAELARQQGAFGPDDVIRGICEKLVRRHPHVFAGVEVSSTDQVLANWEAIKAEEKERALLDGIPRSLPALLRAQRISERVSRVGFDWQDAGGSRQKVGEELNELDQALAAGDPERVQHELGDLLFALVNLARHQGIDPEAALSQTSERFMARFAHVEQRVRERHGGWPRGGDGRPGRGIALEELEAYWQEAKRAD